MSSIDTPFASLARPPRFEGRLSFPEFLRRVKDSSIATWPEEAFEKEFWGTRRLWQRIFVANSPETIRHVLLDNADNYVKSPLARGLLEPGIGRGLLTAEGEDWRRQRRIMAPAFQHKRIVDATPAIGTAIDRLLARWDTGESLLNISDEMGGLTLAIISDIMFSAGDDPAIARIGVAVDRYQTVIRPAIADILGLPDWVPRGNRRKAVRLFAEADRVISDLIARRRTAAEPGSDLLGMLIAAPETGDKSLTAREIRDEVATIMTAGHETTANALSWTWYLLSQHPDVEARLHAEVDTVLGDRPARFADMARLPYTRMIVDESLRLYPPAHTLSRMPLADDEIAGVPVPKGSTVLIVPWLLHRHRLLWEAPERFDPDRMTAEKIAARPRYAYIPFGAGPRICIGASLALTEAVLILASLARRWRLRLADGAVIEPMGLITLRPRHGMPMRLERR